MIVIVVRGFGHSSPNPRNARIWSLEPKSARAEFDVHDDDDDDDDDGDDDGGDDDDANGRFIVNDN